MTVKQKLEQKGIELTSPTPPAASYVPVVRQGNTLFVSGQISMTPSGLLSGCLGSDLSLEEGQKAAASCAINILAHLAHTEGVLLDRIRIVKLTVLVASTQDFTQQHLVANGASDLLAEVLGENGKHARAAFGVAALPMGAAVEIEAIAEILD